MMASVAGISPPLGQGSFVPLPMATDTHIYALRATSLSGKVQLWRNGGGVVRRVSGSALGRYL